MFHKMSHEDPAPSQPRPDIDPAGSPQPEIQPAEAPMEMPPMQQPGDDQPAQM